MRRWLPGWLGLPRLDPVMLALVGLVIAVGLAMVYSASGQNIALVERQATMPRKQDIRCHHCHCHRPKEQTRATRHRVAPSRM